MASTATTDRLTPKAWPALAALFVVVVLGTGMVGLDLVIDTSTADATAVLVDNSLRSITLVDDLRSQAYQLSRADLDAEQRAVVIARIDVDAREYDPIATYVGEAEAWHELRGELEALRIHRSGDTRDIEATIARLIEINEREAADNADAIVRDHHRRLITNIIVGLATLGLAMVVAVALRRGIRRQRELLALHLAALDEKAKELEAFSSRVSHELKGALGPLRAYADTMQIHPAGDVREVGGRIRRGVDRMTDMVEDLLALSVEGQPRPGSIRVAPIIKEVLAELSVELHDADIAVRGGDHATQCSASVLAQILKNVLTNSAKYRSPSRRLAIAIETAIVPDGIAITLTDNGAGMEDDAVERAFDAHYRAPSASVPGHGLGLSIVRRAVESIGGRVTLTSEVGTGTKVHVVLPAASQS